VVNDRVFRVGSLCILLVNAACSANSQELPGPQFDAAIAMEFRDSTVEVCEGGTQFMPVAIGWTGAGAAPAEEPPSLVWESADSTIARVSPGGEITGRRAGHTILTAFAHWGGRVGRKQLPVKVMRGAFDEAASEQSGTVVCGK
jgi:hypothetical protein